MVATIQLDRSKCRQLDNHRVMVFWDHGEDGEKHRTGLVCGLAMLDDYDVDDPAIDFGVVSVDERATEAEYRFEDDVIVLRDSAGWSREEPLCWMTVRLADGSVVVEDPSEEHDGLVRRLATPLASGELLDYLHSVNRACQDRQNSPPPIGGRITGPGECSRGPPSTIIRGRIATAWRTGRPSAPICSAALTRSARARRSPCCSTRGLPDRRTD